MCSPQHARETHKDIQNQLKTNTYLLRTEIKTATAIVAALFTKKFKDKTRGGGIAIYVKDYVNVPIVVRLNKNI